MRDLTRGVPQKLIRRFTAPLLISNLLIQLYQVADAVIVGRFLGKEALAAVGTSVPLVFVLISLMIGCGIGSTVQISQYFGSRNIDRIKAVIDTMTVFIVTSSLLMTCIGIWIHPVLLHWLHTPQDVLPQASAYLTVYLIGILPLFSVNSTTAVLRGLGDSYTPFLYILLSTVLNIVLDLVFIQGFGWGIRGVAWATVITESLVGLLLIVYLNRRHPVVRIRLLTAHFDWNVFRTSLKIGLPTGLHQTFTSMGNAAMLRIISPFGTAALAAYTGVSRIEMFIMAMMSAYGMTATAYVGQHIGAHAFMRLFKGVRVSIALAVQQALVLSVALVLARTLLMQWFTRSEDLAVIELGAQYLSIVAPFYLVYAITTVLNGALRGAGDTLIPMFISLVSLWIIRIPLASCLSAFWDIRGIWWAIPVGWIIGLILYALYGYRQINRLGQPA